MQITECLGASEYIFIKLYEGIRCLHGMCSQHSEKLEFAIAFGTIRWDFWATVFAYSVGTVLQCK